MNVPGTISPAEGPAEGQPPPTYSPLRDAAGGVTSEAGTTLPPAISVPVELPPETDGVPYAIRTTTPTTTTTTTTTTTPICPGARFFSQNGYGPPDGMRAGKCGTYTREHG